MMCANNFVNLDYVWYSIYTHIRTQIKQPHIRRRKMYGCSWVL